MNKVTVLIAMTAVMTSANMAFAQRVRRPHRSPRPTPAPAQAPTPTPRPTPRATPTPTPVPAKPSPTPASQPATSPAPSVVSIDLSKSGTFRSGSWRYYYEVTTDNQGNVIGFKGRLYDPALVDGAPGKSVESPWGTMYYAGADATPRGPRGFLPLPPELVTPESLMTTTDRIALGMDRARTFKRLTDKMYVQLRFVPPEVAEAAPRHSLVVGTFMPQVGKDTLQDTITKEQAIRLIDTLVRSGFWAQAQGGGGGGRGRYNLSVVAYEGTGTAQKPLELSRDIRVNKQTAAQIESLKNAFMATPANAAGPKYKADTAVLGHINTMLAELGEYRAAQEQAATQPMTPAP